MILTLLHFVTSLVIFVSFLQSDIVIIDTLIFHSYLMYKSHRFAFENYLHL